MPSLGEVSSCDIVVKIRNIIPIHVLLVRIYESIAHTSHNGDLARMNFRLKNDNTIDLDYPCALQNTLVFGL